MRSKVSWKRWRVSLSMRRIADSRVVRASVRSANCRSRYFFALGLLLEFVDRRQIHRTEARNTLGRLREAQLPGCDGCLWHQPAQHRLQVKAGYSKLFRERLTTHAYFLSREARLFHRATHFIDAGFAADPLLLQAAQGSLGCFQRLAGLAQFLIDCHLLRERLFQRPLHFYERCGGALNLALELDAPRLELCQLRAQALQRAEVALCAARRDSS